ncbi:MAG: ImmA/IrrE family metallo-endopeptidase [Polyangia bacterium]
MALLDLTGVTGNASEVGVVRKFSGAWSAMAYREHGGVWLITWNPWHAETRIRVSLMEEVAHIILDHAPTKMVSDPRVGLPRRTYSPSKEKEAYGVAGAALVPYNGIMAMLQRGAGVSNIAVQYKVSEALVQMRLKVTGAQSAVLQSPRR